MAPRPRAIPAPEPDGPPHTGERLWTQKEAAAYLGVSPRYLRESSCPKVLLPSNGTKDRAVVRYLPEDVRAWALKRRVA